MSNKEPKITMADIPIGRLFVLQGVGALRKTDNMVGTHLNGKTYVIYPYERVTVMKPKGVR